MKCHTLGKRAYRVTKKYELVTITAPLFDTDLLKVSFKVAGLAVTGMGLRQVGADMDMNKIETYVDPDLGPEGLTDACGEPAGTIRVVFNPSNMTPFDMSAQALVVHEGVHALLRRTKMGHTGHLEEAAAYLAQALFFELKGESILEDWENDNQWAFTDHMKSIVDPIQGNAKARIYAAAVKVIDAFDLDSSEANLSPADVADLVKAISRDPGYAVPKKPSAPKSKPRPSTLRERIRRRREERRARRAH